MHARQALGESLVQLPEKQLAKMPITSEELLEAIAECRRIRSNSARKRHMQYIGKLMRDIDPQPLEDALAALHQSKQEKTDDFHALEQLRDDILSQGPRAVDALMLRWPDADRQHLRQLILQHQREVQKGKPPAASRKLFRYLRELSELYGDGD